MRRYTNGKTSGSVKSCRSTPCHTAIARGNGLNAVAGDVNAYHWKSGDALIMFVFNFPFGWLTRPGADESSKLRGG